MNLNKRYSIRKLSVGVASVAIGFFISTNTDLMTSIGQNISPIAYAEEVVKEWRPEGVTIANGIDGIHWTLYENGYLEFNPSQRNPRMTGVTKETDSETLHKPSWHQYADKIKAIGFTSIAYAPEDSSYLFANLPNLEYIDAKKLQLVYPDKVHFYNTKAVTNIDYMFSQDRKLQNLDLSNWDVSNVRSMISTFDGLRSLRSLNVSNWNTGKVTTMKGLFAYTRELQDLNISQWDVSHVTDFSSMFEISAEDDNSFNSLDISNWDTRSLVNANRMFWGRQRLTSIDLSRWNTENLESINLMLSGVSLKHLDVGNWNTTKLKTASYFIGGSKIESVNLTNWNTTNLIGDTLFRRAINVKEITIGKNFANNSTFLFKPLDNYEQPQNIYTKIFWKKADGSSDVYTRLEWEKAFKASPESLSGTWIREKVGYRVNFHTGTSETINSIEEAPLNQTILLQSPRTPDLFHNRMSANFLGWSKTINGPIITEAKNLGETKSVVELYAQWEIQEYQRQRTTMTTVYRADNTLANGQIQEEAGYDGEKEIITTYIVHQITGGEPTNPRTRERTIAEMRPKVIKIGTKPTVEYIKKNNDVVKKTTTYTMNPQNGTTISSVTEVVHSQNGAKDKVEYLKRNNGLVKKTTTYSVNITNGEVTPNIQEENVRVQGMDSLADKIEYIKKGNDVVKKVTVYNVNIETGAVTPSVTETIHNANGAKDKVEYIKKNNSLVKRTTHYDVNLQTGAVTPSSNVQEETVSPSTLGNENITSLADKIEYVKQGNDVIKRTTTYDVNIETGKITPQVTDVIYNQGGTTPKVEYIKRGNDIVKQTTNYDVNPQNGEVTPNQNIAEETVSPTSLGNENITSLEDRVEYFKQGNNVMKRVTTYNVDLHTGKVTPNVTETIRNENGAKDKVEYIKKENNLVKRITHYDVDINTGNITPNSNVIEEVVQPSSLGNENITSLADKIEYVKQGNDVIKRTTTYDVNINTGKVTPQVTDETYNQGGITPKVEYIKRGNDIVKQTTNYDVNPQNGEITPNQNIVEETVSPSSLGNENIDTLADKVEYFKQGNNVMKRVTTYDVDLHTGKVTPNITETVHSENGAKDKVEYIKKESTLVKKTTHYDVDLNTGNVTPNTHIDEENIEPSSLGNENITSLADKIEYVKQGNDVIKRTTRYEVNIETGKVTPQVTDETYNQGGITPKVEYIKRGNEIVKQTTNYNVNSQNGEITPNQNIVEETVSPASLGNENIDSLEDKIEYFKQGNNVMKRVTIYDVDLHTGKVTPNITETVYSENGAKDKIEYIKKENNLVKRITHYDVDTHTGNVTPNSNVEEENIQPSALGNENITSLADKIEYIKQDNDVIKRTTRYDVNVETGKVTPSVVDETYNQGATTPKVEYIKRGNDIIKQTTNYDVNPQNGEVTPSSDVTEEVVTPSSLGNDSITSLEDRIEYFKQGNNVMKRVTTYDVDLHTGKVTPNITETVHSENGAKDKVEYIKKESTLVKKTTHYDVDLNTGNVTPNTHIDEENIEPSSLGNENITSLADKIEYVKQGNDVIKRTTTYDVNIETGKITPQVTDEVYNQGGTTPKVEYVKRGNNIVKQTTNYDVDIHTGTVTPNSNIAEDVVEPSSLGNANIDSLADKVEYFKQNNNVMKRVTTYDVDLHTGKVTPNVTETVHNENGAKDKVEYVKQNNSLVKKTTHYDVDTQTGNVIANSNIDEETIEPTSVGNENIESLADKVEYIKQGNDVIKRTTRYDVNVETGKVTPQVTDETYNQGGTTPKVAYVKRGTDIIKQTTNYVVNLSNGEITPDSNVIEETVQPSSLGNENIESLADKVEYFKQDNNVMKRVTTYDVDLHTGKVTSKITETVHSENGAKDKVEYIKQDNSLIKKTTHYDVDINTGNVTPNSHIDEENIEPSSVGNENITTLVDKVEYIKQGNDVIKRTTKYDVNVETGKVTPQVTDETYNQGGTTPKVEYIKRGNDIIKQTTNYVVNVSNGEVTPDNHVEEEVVQPSSLGNDNIDSLDDKTEYFKQGNNIMKRVTTYNVDIHTGKVIPNVIETIHNENGAKDKIEYIKKNNELIKKTTHYDVDTQTGNIIVNNNIDEETVTPESVGNENIPNLADKIEYVKQGNDVIKRTTTYDVNIETGKVTPQVVDETYNQGGTTPKVEYIKRGNNIVKQTTNYDVDTNTGTITPNSSIKEDIVQPSSLGNDNIDSLDDKIEYFKQGNNIIKRVTTYDVDIHTGKVTPNTTETVHIENGARDKVEYIKQDNSLIKKITHYDVDLNTGNVTPNSHIDEETVEPSSLGNENITSLADKIEYVKQGNDVIKRTTKYDVNVETGKVTPQVIDETYNQGGTTPKVEYIKRDNNIVKQTTNYEVDTNTGIVTPNTNVVEEIVPLSSLGNDEVNTLEDKVEYFKQGDNVMKRVTTYEVDLHTGKVVPNVTETVYRENTTKDKIEYVKQDDKLVKKIIHYDVDATTGNVTPNSNVTEEIIQPSTVGNDNIDTLKDKVEYIKQGNNVIKRITRYDVNVETGKVTPNVTEETYSQGETTTKIEYIKRGNEIVKRTTEFEVDITDGTLKPNSVEEVVTPASLGNNEINNVGDKVEYIKKDGDIIKKTITYDVNISDGSITPVETEVIYAKDGADDSIEYIKRGNDIIKQITEYEVDRYTGEVTPKVREEVYIKDGVKEKVEFVKENGNVIKQTTKYDVDVHTGNVIPHTESEVHNPVGLDNVNDKVEYVKQGNEIIKRITKYEVDITTGNVTPSTTEENVTPNGNGNIEDKVEFTKQGNEIVKSTTTFIVDEHTGNITLTTKTEIVTPASLGNNEIDNVGDKVEYVKKDGDIIKKITKYDVNILDGSITPVETEVIYAKDGADDSIEYIKRGNDIIKQITEYEVDKYTGEVTPKVREEVYVKDGVKDKVEFVKENGNVIKQITKYDVDVHTGHITSHIEKETHNPQGLDSVNDKVEYVKQGDTIVKREIKYDVDIHTGNVTPIVSETTLKNNDTDALKDKVEYVKKGNDIVKVTTIVTVEPDTGLLQSETIETVHIKDGADDSVTYIKRGNDVIKQVTKYEVDKYTGEVTSTIIEEIVQKDSVKDKVEYVKRGNEIVKQITTYKVNKDTGEITSEVKIDEKVDSLTTSIEENGNTQKQLSSNIDKSLISNKENTKAIDENVLVTNDSNIQNNDESLMNRKENQELPKTNALYSTSYILGLLLSVVGLKQNKKD